MVFKNLQILFINFMIPFHFKIFKKFKEKMNITIKNEEQITYLYDMGDIYYPYLILSVFAILLGVSGKKNDLLDLKI